MTACPEGPNRQAGQAGSSSAGGRMGLSEGCGSGVWARGVGVGGVWATGAVRAGQAGRVWWPAAPGS